MSDNPRVQAYPFSFFLCYILIIIFILYPHGPHHSRYPDPGFNQEHGTVRLT